MKKLMGKKVRITSDNDNYDAWRDQDLTIVSVAYNKDQHPGYDSAMEGEALVDLEDENGATLPFSLYEYEFKLV